MANYLEAYAIDSAALVRAPAPPRQWNPATLQYSRPAEPTLLAWVAAERARAAAEGAGVGPYRLSYVQRVLLSDAGWRHGAPGITAIAAIRGLGAAIEDLEALAADLPEPLRRRLAEGPADDPSGGTDFPPDLPADSPLRALDFYGWQLLAREDFEALRARYLAADKEALAIGSDGFEDWGELFAPREEPYDYVLFVYEL